MSITAENRKIRDYLRKRLIRLAAATGGEVRERRGAGGKIISTYKWLTSRGEGSFRISWHNSVSDRHFPNKIRGDIKRNLIAISELYYEDEITKSEILNSAGIPGRSSLASVYKPVGIYMIEHRLIQWLEWQSRVLENILAWITGPRSHNNKEYWEEENNNAEEFPNDFLNLADIGGTGGQFGMPDDIYAYEVNAVFMFHELDEISMLYANRSLMGWCERAMFWSRRRNPKYYTSSGVLP
jgi:hypothetical protein